MPSVWLFRPAALSRLLPALALGLTLAGCVMPNTYGELSPNAFQPSDRPVTIENVSRNDRMAEIARAQHPKILATYGGEYSDPKLERMVAKVVGQLTLDGDKPDQTYRITILNSPNVNAFALPGGYLYVTRGLLALANDSAELAAVISHEMGHVTANHGVERQRKEAEEVLASRVVSDVLGDSPATQAALIRNKLQLAQFSRNQELEADAIGIRSSARAGFDAYAAARFLQSMQAYSSLRSVSGASDPSLDFLASHPSTPQRIALAESHAAQFGPPGGTGSHERDGFLAGIDGLLYGDTPEEGYVRGSTFLHPKLGIAFSVPENFVIDNSAAAVTATGPGDMALRFDGVALDPDMSLADYLRSGWVAGLDPASVQEGEVGGRPAAFARASADAWMFSIAVVRDGPQVYRLLSAAPASGAPLEPFARAVSGSFRFLTPEERSALQPLRIRVVTVGPRDTVGTLSARMTGVDRKLELFRVLNALPATGTVKAGDKVKIVTDR
jgi:predicted Zn-dependent protease